MFKSAPVLWDGLLLRADSARQVRFSPLGGVTPVWGARRCHSLGVYEGRPLVVDACPAGGSFLVRQKGTERGDPGCPRDPAGQRRRSLCVGPPDAAAGASTGRPLLRRSSVMSGTVTRLF